MNTLGERLRSLRLEKGLSQKEVAEQLRLPSSSYRDLEANSNSRHIVDALPKLAKLFEVSTNFLLGEESKTSAVDDCRRIQELAEGVIKKINF